MYMQSLIILEITMFMNVLYYCTGFKTKTHTYTFLCLICFQKYLPRFYKGNGGAEAQMLPHHIYIIEVCKEHLRLW